MLRNIYGLEVKIDKKWVFCFVFLFNCIIDCRVYFIENKLNIILNYVISC